MPPGAYLKDGFRVIPNRVDIWSVPTRTTEQILDRLRQNLSSDEEERAVRFHKVEDQQSFIASRGILRTMLSSYLHVPPNNLIFRYGKKGKPALENDSKLHFNLAHAGGKAIFAFGDDDLGVDIEFIKPWQDWQKISVRFFSQREAEELFKSDPATQLSDFFACWARKEAYIKAIGEGMAVGLNQFYVGADRAISSGPVERNGYPPQWYFKDLDAGERYAGALVTRFRDCQVRVFSFDQVADCLDYLEIGSG